MKVTYAHGGSGGTIAITDATSDYATLPEYDGQPLKGVSFALLPGIPGGAPQLHHIAAGGHFAMHDTPSPAFLQVVTGRGKVVFADGTVRDYEAPELFVLQPGAPHEWRDIEEDTLLSVVILDA